MIARILAIALIVCTSLFAEDIVPTHSAAYEAGHVLKSSPGTLLHLQGYNSKGSAQFIQIHDSATVPSDAVSGVAEIFTVDFGSLTGTDVAGKYFTTADANGSVYFWFDTGSDEDPEPEGISRGIEVDINGSDNADSLATALAAAADADAAFSATATTDTATITNSATGARTNAADGDTSATIETTQQGVTAITAAVPALVITVAASSNFSIPLPATGIPFSNGISVCNSSTGPTKTAGSSDCFFTATVK